MWEGGEGCGKGERGVGRGVCVASLVIHGRRGVWEGGEGVSNE